MGRQGRAVATENDTRRCPHTYKPLVERVSIGWPLQKLFPNPGEKELSRIQPDLHSGSSLGAYASHLDLGS